MHENAVTEEFSVTADDGKKYKTKTIFLIFDREVKKILEVKKMTNKPKNLAIFEGNHIRRQWDGEKELWYFSVSDIIAVLTKSIDAGAYWRKMKQRLREEGSEVVTKCHELKFMATDGKYYTSDAADTETMLRLIQSIPSPNAEPFKLWLAKVGYERLEETADPELAINRALRTYFQKGYTREWINLRLKSIELRKGLTDEWEKRGVKEGLEFAILTDEITKAWAGMTTKQYKQHKDLKKENLRDNMTNMELVLNMLAETATVEISEKIEPKNLEENKKVARDGGGIAGNARKEIELKTGKKVITKKNFKDFQEGKKRIEEAKKDIQARRVSLGDLKT